MKFSLIKKKKDKYYLNINNQEYITYEIINEEGKFIKLEKIAKNENFLKLLEDLLIKLKINI